jgi:protein-S-isoprenylcysteine O-methyltransferase Ste14
MVTVVASGLAILAYELEPRTPLVSFSGNAAALPATAVAAAATYIAIRIVVARSQPVTNPRLVEIDDALRTQAVHTIAGAGIGIAFLGTSSCMFEMAGYSSFEWLRITGVVLSIGALVGAVAAWTFCTASWRVHRTVSV